MSGWNREGFWGFQPCVLEPKKGVRATRGPGTEGQRRMPGDSRCGGRAAAAVASPLRTATAHGPPLRQGPPL